LSLLFSDGDSELASERSISPPALERRGKSWIVVVVAMVVILDLTDVISATLPPATVNTGDVDVDADVNAADTDDVTTLGDPSAGWRRRCPS
jgi:hypothetical protein